jgi:hypothetical protein
MDLKQKRLPYTSNPSKYYIKISSNKGLHHAIAKCHHQFLFVLVKFILQQIWNSFYDLQNLSLKKFKF